MGHPLLADLIDFFVQQRRDAPRPAESLRRRDREIGLQQLGEHSAPQAQLAAWLAAVDDGSLPGRRVVALQHITNLLLALLGLAVGWGGARLLLYYDGTEPVNIIAVLSLLVGVQLLLAALLGITLLPARLLHRLPGARALQEHLALLSPGQLRRVGRRFLPQEYRQTATAVLAAGASHRRLFSRVEKWAVQVSAQTFAVAFNLGALGACVSLVAFTDLAFAWSTTLQVDAAALQRLTHALATPWAWLVPQADPSPALIEATRYYRFKEGTLPAISAADPARLGQWWPFLVACLTAYGLLPRLALLALARARFTCAVRYTLGHAAGVAEVLDRLTGELVETRAQQPEIDGSQDAAAADPPAADLTPAPGRSCQLVNWAQLALDDAAACTFVLEHTGWCAARVLHAGGARSLDDDRETIACLQATTGEEPVLILVKSWEPAMLEFLDFLGDLRRALGDGRPITVVPLGRSEPSGFAAPTPRDLEQWQRRVQQSADPWTRVHVPAAQEAT